MGRICIAEFIDRVAPVLHTHATGEVNGREWFELVQQTTQRIDDTMVRAVDALASRGIPTSLLSNSWGPPDAYPWARLLKFSAVFVSSEVGMTTILH